MKKKPVKKQAIPLPKLDKMSPPPMNTICLKRVFRWTFAFITKGTCLTQEHWVKSVILPEYVLRRENNKVVERGWTQLIVTFYDIASQHKDLWDWILSRPIEQTAATLKYYDGCGELLEELIFQLEPARIKIADLDYASSAESCIEVAFNTKGIERILPQDYNEEHATIK